MYLLDTNIWLWMVEEPQRLSAEIATIVKNADNYPFFLSAISVWEVAKKVSLGKLGLSIPVRDWLDKATQDQFIHILPLSVNVSLESTILPGTFHKDPADQIIVATARILQCPLMTVDEKICNYSHVTHLLP